MGIFFDIEETAKKTGLPQSRLRYIEARFPALINRRLADPHGRFYSLNQIKTFEHLDQLLKTDDPRLSDYTQNNTRIQRGTVIVFASGKGGVGKTSMAVNLSSLTPRLNLKTILIDGDLSMANAHTLLGLRPEKNIASLFSEGITLNEIMLQTSYGFTFIPGGCGLSHLADLDNRSLDLLIEEIETLRRQFDYIIIDASAGIGKTVLGWIKAADELVVVTTPLATALLDAYGLIKVCKCKGYTAKLNILVNMVKNRTEGETIFENLNRCAIKFLNQPLKFIGCVRKDLKFEQALSSRIPVAVDPYKSINTSNLYSIAKSLFLTLPQRENYRADNSFILKTESLNKQGPQSPY